VAGEASVILDAWRARTGPATSPRSLTTRSTVSVIIGSVDECRRKLQAFHDAGVTTPMVHPFLFDVRAISAALEGLAPGSPPVL
jgi:alkanesulfonate monooxygenase SsuD/methylene tetrahydromethanopterin reductase-like flavin-dependent oxidoreductase (luciferase family)